MYDNNGNLAIVLDRKSQTTVYTYDPLNRCTKTLFRDSTSINYTYDAGNRIQVIEEKDASNVMTATITCDYDGRDRLTQEGTVNYTYDDASRRVMMAVAGQPPLVAMFCRLSGLLRFPGGRARVRLLGQEVSD